MLATFVNTTKQKQIWLLRHQRVIRPDHQQMELSTDLHHVGIDKFLADVCSAVAASDGFETPRI